MECALRLILAAVWSIAPLRAEACPACDSDQAGGGERACCAASAAKMSSCCAADEATGGGEESAPYCTRRCQCCSDRDDAAFPPTRSHQDSPVRTSAAAFGGALTIPPANSVFCFNSEVLIAVNAEPTQARLCVWLD